MQLLECLTAGSIIRLPFVPGIVVCCTLGLFGPVAMAVDDIEFGKNRDTIAREFELWRPGDYKSFPGMGNRVGYKHQASVELQTDRNENLDINDPENRDVYALEYDIAAQYRHSSRLQYFGRIDLSFERNSRQDRVADSELALELKTFYAKYLFPTGKSSLTIGRQQLKDEREWLFDEELDGVGYEWGTDSRALVAFVGREELFRKDFLGEHDREKQSLYYLRYYWPVGDRRQASTYALYVDDRGYGNNEQALFVGARSYGRWSSGIDYWVEGAAVTGTREGESNQGFGFDLGFTREFKKLDARPSLSVALAYGSGPRDGQAGSGFRQTGLHGNSFKLGGVVSIDRYGHGLEPELNNMVITTLGVGFRPEKYWSMDILFHRYWQAQLADELRDSNLDTDPNGQNKTLGTGLDIVLGLRNWKNLSVEAVIGVFWPGAAFDEGAGTARHAELLLKWKLP